MNGALIHCIWHRSTVSVCDRIVWIVFFIEPLDYSKTCTCIRHVFCFSGKMFKEVQFVPLRNFMVDHQRERRRKRESQKSSGFYAKQQLCTSNTLFVKLVLLSPQHDKQLSFIWKWEEIFVISTNLISKIWHLLLIAGKKGLGRHGNGLFNSIQFFISHYIRYLRKCT